VTRCPSTPGLGLVDCGILILAGSIHLELAQEDVGGFVAQCLVDTFGVVEGFDEAEDAESSLIDVN